MSRKNTRLMTMHEWRSRCCRAFGKLKAVQDELEEIRIRLAHIEKCESLQSLLHRYCELRGWKHEQIGGWIRFYLPSGVKATIYHSPMLSIHSGEPICGYLEDPKNRIGGLKYLVEQDAIYLYENVKKKIKELEKEIGTEKQRKED